MTKMEFIACMKPILKEMGFRKTNHYWHRVNGGLILCIFVQGSSWSADNYYAEVGWALPQEGRRNPTLLHWGYRARIGNTNPEPGELLVFLKGSAFTVSTLQELARYMCAASCQPLGSTGQYFFEPV